MSALLTEIGKKLADRWLDLLVLPGLLWIAAVTVATRLGQEHALDLGRLRVSLDQIAAHPASHSLAAVLLATVGLLLASATAGLGAGALGILLQRLWVLPGHSRLLSAVVARRQNRWNTATATLRKAIAKAANPATPDKDRASAVADARHAQRLRSRLGGTRPERPTWIGQRFHVATTRIDSAYGLDLDLAWPRLWTLLPDVLRTDLATAQDAYVAAARLTAWGLLYAAVGVAWWPAVVIGFLALTVAWLRARKTAAVLADLVETACDLHTSTLAVKLGLDARAPLAAETGRSISEILRKTPL